MVVFGKDRDVFSRGDGSHAGALAKVVYIMDDEKQSITSPRIKKEAI